MASRQALGTLVERAEALFARLKDEWDVGAGGVGHVHAVVEHDVGAEACDGGAVHGEFAERHGFVVTLPVVLAFGDALECAARVGDFDVVVLQEDFSDGHEAPFLDHSARMRGQLPKMNRVRKGDISFRGR